LSTTWYVLYTNKPVSVAASHSLPLDLYTHVLDLSAMALSYTDSLEDSS